MRALLIGLILVAALINLLPVLGAASAPRLASLYGVVLDDPNLVILMRHRALLFGVVGSLLAASAFHRALRPIAFAAGLFSMLSFVVIVWLVGDHNAELGRVVVVDLVGLAALVAAAVIDSIVRRQGSAPPLEDSTAA